MHRDVLSRQSRISVIEAFCQIGNLVDGWRYIRRFVLMGSAGDRLGFEKYSGVLGA